MVVLEAEGFLSVVAGNLCVESSVAWQTKRMGHTFMWALLLVMALTKVGPSRSRQLAVKGLVLGLILSLGKLPIL